MSHTTERLPVEYDVDEMRGKMEPAWGTAGTSDGRRARGSDGDDGLDDGR
jgi:hypothetical protein